MDGLKRSELSTMLREHGYRVTPQRLAVYEVLARSRDHLTPERVLDAVRERHPSVSLNTVYEVLETLTTIGAIRRADVGAGPRRYDANMEPHHHIVCRSCGLQADVPYARVSTTERWPDSLAGFAVEEMQVTYFGLCANCQPSVASAAG